MMIRLFVYLVIILALGFGFSWIADHPGIVTLNWQGKDIRTSLMVVVVAIVALVAIILFIWGLVRGVIGLPFALSRFFSHRRRDQGYRALSKGLIAAGTGDKALARRLAKESGKLLSDEPLVDLLDAQTSLLEGNQMAARTRFQAMLENEDTKLLGLRGLYLEAEREGAREASRQYADEASALAPSLAWAGNAKLRNQSMDANWEEALKTLETNRSAGLMDKETAKRRRAVLLTARAMAEEPVNPDLAAKLANEAHRLAPDLVPAAIIGATAYMRGNNLRKASRLIEAVWKKSPHPELAEAYINLRMGDSVSDRFGRAQTLAKMRSNHPQSNLALAQAAIDAKDWKSARDAMKSILVNNLSERACLIMAEIEEGEHGDAGRMRDWLSRAVRAPRDAKWTAGGYTSETWLPISPVTGEIDVFEWKVPVEQLQVSTDTIDIGDLAEPLKPIAPVEADEKSSSNAELTHNTGIVATDAAQNEKGIATDNGGHQDNLEHVASDIEDATIVELVPKDGIKKTENTKSENDEDLKTDISADNSSSGEINAADAKELEEEEPTETVFPLPRRPDDPGVPEEKTDRNKEYKNF